MTLRSQAMTVALLVLAVGAGSFWLWQRSVDGGAEAAVDRRGGAVRVELAAARAGTVQDPVEAVGTTLARQAVDIVPMTSGRIIELGFEPGAEVARGDLLARLDDGAERAAVAEAEASLREAELALERARRLRTNNTVAQATVDELEAGYLGARARLDRALKQLDDRTVVAPFDGIVGMRRVDLGARVDDDTVLATLDDLDEVLIEFSVPEVFFGRIRPEQPVAATSSAFPGRVFEGRIQTIDTRIGEVSRAVKVRALLPNPDRILPAGMFMHVEVVLGERPAVLVPEAAVVAEGDSTFVYTVQSDIAGRRPVTLGQRRGGLVEVLDGLEAGEQVVERGLQQLREGAAVEIVERVSPADEGA